MAASTRLASAPRATAASTLALTISLLPSFVLGGVAVLARRELDFSESRLGFAISTYFVVSAAASVMGGRLSERLGGIRALRVGVAISTVSLIGAATAAHAWIHLVGWLALGGLANAILQPATNLAIARAVPRGRQAIALGIKQTNGPLATLIAGLSAPLIGVTLGWRWAFAAAALMSVAFYLVTPSRLTTPPAAPELDLTAAVPRAALVRIAAGAGFGVAAAMALVGFYMDSAVALGHGIAEAGAYLAVGSAVGAAARIGWGWFADRRRVDGAALIAGMLTVGAFGYAALAFSGHPVTLVLMTILVFVTGWGWVGLVHLVTIELAPAAPGRASGIVNVGVGLGGVAGPATFGMIAERFGYRPAWIVGALALIAAAALIRAGGRRGPDRPAGQQSADGGLADGHGVPAHRQPPEENRKQP
jgi:MFS family permease